jgi:hypothetical protein
MKYEFHPAALQEYAEAVEFFAQQDRQGDRLKFSPLSVTVFHT